MTDHPERAHGSSQAPATVWTGRATNRIQWLLALTGAGCVALGIELAVVSPWSSGIAPLLMSVIGCLAVGLLILFGMLAFVHVAVKVDGDSLEVQPAATPACRAAGS
ncbi:Lipoprotein OS=Streptomyces microflavus OX=1919 GN=Smic_02620 PE=4 SV=1 [Streptomyces microflavus]